MPKGGAESRASEKFKRALFLAMKNNLTERQREAMILYYSEGMKMSDIAKLWGVSPSAVSRHISRGRERVQNTVIAL